MNIKITDNWLKEYLDYDCSPYDLQKYLSLCGPSVETVKKIQNDFIYDIEITSNRIDTASVFGIAQESFAILPQFNKKTIIKFDPLKFYNFKKIKIKNEKKLEIVIEQKNLAYRISAVVLSSVKIKKSPKVIRQRLLDCGINPINNVVDISNYLRIALGQPCHIFDYDKISGGKMLIRKSKRGEKIVTLDKDIVILPGDDIVISDGSGKLIDQPGIMGAFNSSVKSDTKNVILFVPIFNGQMVRRTSMLTGKRSDSASYFEKGLDVERTETTLAYGINLLKEFANARVSSKIIDIKEKKDNPKKINVLLSEINNLIGTEVNKKEVFEILKRLNFNFKNKGDKLYITPPSYRKNDISIREDIIEEVARIYGYSNIPSNLQVMKYIEPQINTEKYTNYIYEIKNCLKNFGLNEIINYSMISKFQIEKIGDSVNEYLKLTNPISTDLEYMRKDLLPSFLSNVKTNINKNEIKIFEISNVYKNNKSEFPNEKLLLGVLSDKSFFDLKGIIQGLFDNLNIKPISFKASSEKTYSKNLQAEIYSKEELLGHIGSVSHQIINNFGISKSVFFCQLDLSKLINAARILPEYKKPPVNAIIKLDLTLKIKNFEEFKNKSFKSSKYLIDLEIVDKYEDRLSIRFYFTSYEKNLTEKEALKELAKIKKDISINH